MLLKIHWQINVVSSQMQTNRMNLFEMWNLGQTAQTQCIQQRENVKINRKTHEMKIKRRVTLTQIFNRIREKFYCVGQTNSIKKIVGLFVLVCLSFNMLLARSLTRSQRTIAYIISS